MRHLSVCLALVAATSLVGVNDALVVPPSAPRKNRVRSEDTTKGMQPPIIRDAGTMEEQEPTSSPSQRQTFGTTALIRRNNVTEVYYKLFAAVMDRSKRQLTDVFSPSSHGFTVGPIYYPFPNQTALVDMLLSAGKFNPVYAFYNYGVPSFQNEGVYVGDAPFITNGNFALIPTDFLYIHVDKETQSQIQFYEEFVPLSPLANETECLGAFKSLMGAFATGDSSYVASNLAEDFQLKLGVEGDENWTMMNKTSYMEQFNASTTTRDQWIWKLTTSQVAANTIHVQYSWINTVKSSSGGAPQGSMGRDTLKITVRGNGDLTITAIYGFRNIDWAYN